MRAHHVLIEQKTTSKCQTKTPMKILKDQNDECRLQKTPNVETRSVRKHACMLQIKFIWRCQQKM